MRKQSWGERVLENHICWRFSSIHSVCLRVTCMQKHVQVISSINYPKVNIPVKSYPQIKKQNSASTQKLSQVPPNDHFLLFLKESHYSDSNILSVCSFELYKNGIVCTYSFGSSFFTQHYGCGIHPYYCMQQQSVHLYFCIVFHYMTVSNFIYLFQSSWSPTFVHCKCHLKFFLCLWYLHFG